MAYNPNGDSTQSGFARTSDVSGEDERELVEDIYMHGCCFYLAAALHLAYGFPIGASIFRMHDGQYSLFHAWVQLPNGNVLDIQGEQEIDQLLEPFRECDTKDSEIHHAMPLDMLERVTIEGLYRFNPSVQQAMLDADTYLGYILSQYKRVDLAESRVGEMS